MSADPRAALNTLVAALERHLEASSARRGEDDPAVIAAYDDLADAFEDYDGALFDAYGEMT
ncbi:MAG TPA: primosomal protein, partial [Ornithinibacter sp.]|nr:primosomal protein [Ornithinibacter sp.]